MDTRIIPEQYRFIDGSMLKLIAIITMLIVHATGAFLRGDETVLFSFFGHEMLLYTFLRYIGRIAFPLFSFLIVEGFMYTSNRWKYGRNLLLFALISEIPWNLEHSGTIFYSAQNVFFTLFLGFLGLCAIERLHGKKQIATLLGLLIVSILLRADYGCSGFGFILLLYLLRNQAILRAVVGSCFLSSRWIAGLAFIPIAFYNDKRGCIKGNWKYCFYLFYPVHMLVIFLIKRHFIGY